MSTTPNQNKRQSGVSNEFAEQTIGNNAIIVIHPGSQTLRLGRASDCLPVCVPHCVARLHRSERQARYDDAWLMRPQTKHSGAAVQIDSGLLEAEEMLGSRPMSNGTLRRATHQRKLQRDNCSVRPVLTSDQSPAQLTNSDHQPQFIVGEKALYIDSPANYSLHWPIRNGQFNLHPGPGGSITSVMADLETIWSTAITTELDIPAKDFMYYRVIIVIPDVMSHRNMKHITCLLLDKLKFSAVILHQESVCATYGAGLASACVVDIGDQKTAVTCVEDGISHKQTRIHMDYGGRDITRCFYELLLRSGVPISRLSLESYIDGLCIQGLKEKFTHLDQDTHGVYEQTIDIHKPSHKHGVQYKVKVGDEAILAPLALFCPDMFGLAGPGLIRTHQIMDPDPEDAYDDSFLRQTQRSTQEGKLNRKKELADSQNTAALDETQPAGGADDDSCDVPDNMAVSETLKAGGVMEESDDECAEENTGGAQLTLMGVDEAIVRSIEKCETDEKRKMYSCILVVGGGGMFAGAMSWLQYRVWSLMSPHARSGLEVMDVMNKPKDLDARMVCWKGAALMASLDTTQELWVRQREWRQDGVRVLREKTPFVW